jgi:hypothetical protein
MQESAEESNNIVEIEKRKNEIIARMSYYKIILDNMLINLFGMKKYMQEKIEEEWRELKFQNEPNRNKELRYTIEDDFKYLNYIDAELDKDWSVK